MFSQYVQVVDVGLDTGHGQSQAVQHCRTTRGEQLGKHPGCSLAALLAVRESAIAGAGLMPGER